MIQVPTLVIHRCGNTTSPVEHSRCIADHAAGAKYVEIYGRDAWPWVGHADAILGEIEHFVTGRWPNCRAPRGPRHGPGHGW
jgi:hypothetical protein